MNEQDLNQVIMAALQQRTANTREAAALKLKLQSASAHMAKCAEVTRMFLEKGKTVWIKNVAGDVSADQMKEWMERVVQLEGERLDLDKQLAVLGVDLGV